MSFEDKAGINVSNHYGPRAVGGTEGVTRTAGVTNEFFRDLDVDGLDFGFPVTDGTAYVTSADVSMAGGTITAVLIGGVDVIGATPEAPVQVPASNTGAVVLTGGNSTGKVLIAFKKYPL